MDLNLADEVRQLRSLVQQLREENARLSRLLKLAPEDKTSVGPSQTGFFERAPGQACLPLTAQVVTAHLSGDLDLGRYPLLDGNLRGWLAADFDGHAAMPDALAYLKAARAVAVPAVLEVSRSGLGAHVWILFAEPVPAADARELGNGLIREAISLSRRVGGPDLAEHVDGYADVRGEVVLVRQLGVARGPTAGQGWGVGRGIGVVALVPHLPGLGGESGAVQEVVFDEQDEVDQVSHPGVLAFAVLLSDRVKLLGGVAVHVDDFDGAAGYPREQVAPPGRIERPTPALGDRDTSSPVAARMQLCSQCDQLWSTVASCARRDFMPTTMPTQLQCHRYLRGPLANLQVWCTLGSPV